MSATAFLAVSLWPGSAWAGKKSPPVPPPLPLEHKHPTGAFTFRTPEGWTVAPSPANPDMLETGDGGDFMVRFRYRAGQDGLDTVHVDCMLERLAGPMATDPHVKYEYDFRGRVIADRVALDSAFVVRYDAPFHGQRDWRQRNLTIVGGGQTLCIMAYAPALVWKKSQEARALLDAVVGSVTFR